MKTPLTITIATLSLLAFTVPAAAQTPPTPQPNQVRQHQPIRQRIRAGVQAGQLTPAEVARLRTRMTTVRQRAQAFRNGGATPEPEQRRMMRRQRLQLNRMIFRLRHNRIIR